ncbi:MAG: PLAC8 family protein, partial [Cyanobacteria bacterium]|nr:PLAC8 family protein [Cyanobacteriota bacterium]
REGTKKKKKKEEKRLAGRPDLYIFFIMSDHPPSAVVYSVAPENAVIVMDESLVGDHGPAPAAEGGLLNDDAVPMLSRPQGQWAHSICQCCSLPGGCEQCCLGTFLGCCQHLKIHSVVERDNPPACCSLIPCAILWAFACVPFASFFYGCFIRRKVRMFLNIPGDDCDDCCIGFWCGCCANIQQANTLVKAGHPARLFMN